MDHLHTVHKGKSWCRRCKTEFPNKQANLEHRGECKRLSVEGECTLRHGRMFVFGVKCEGETCLGYCWIRGIKLILFSWNKFNNLEMPFHLPPIIRLLRYIVGM